MLVKVCCVPIVTLSQLLPPSAVICAVKLVTTPALTVTESVATVTVPSLYATDSDCAISPEVKTKVPLCHPSLQSLRLYLQNYYQ